MTRAAAAVLCRMTTTAVIGAERDDVARGDRCVLCCCQQAAGDDADGGGGDWVEGKEADDGGGFATRTKTATWIGVHYEGKFFEFVPWTGTVSWEISPWGYWKISGENNTHKVELEATTKEAGTPLRAPTIEEGLATACKDTCYGDLTLRIWERRYDGSKGKMIIDVTSDMAAVEVGGGPWFATWKGRTSSPEIVSSALRVPVDMESLYPVPFFKPPGL